MQPNGCARAEAGFSTVETAAISQWVGRLEPHVLQPSPWPCRPAGAGIALLSPDYKAAGPHFAFHVQNRAEVDQVREQLLAKGHSCGPVHDHRDGTASFYMQDPEGNWLEMLYEPAGGLPSNIGAEPIPLTYS